jgi:salicylate hydroxylase
MDCMLTNGQTKFLPQITGEDTPTVKIGKSVYRWLSPLSEVLEHPGANSLWNNARGPGFCHLQIPGSDILMITYPCRNRELLNCAVFHTTLEDEKEKLDWDSNTTHARVLDALAGAHDAILNIPKTAAQLKVYTVTQRPPSKQIYNGKVLAIGDTIHHMLPSHAQGGCAALEDAGALEILFASSTFTTLPPSAAELATRLSLYSQLRLPRAATTQIMSSARPGMTMEGLAGKRAEVRKFYKGDVVDYPLGCTTLSEPVQDFWYGYDVFEQAARAMRYKDSGVVPEGVLKWFGDVKTVERAEFAGIC